MFERNTDKFKPKSGLKRIADNLFGYDYFISYAWKDGRNYAVGLAKELEEHGFDVFLDSDSYSKGDDWKKIGSWALSRTSQLVLVASEHANASKAVERELDIFSSTGRKIIPVDFIDSPIAGLEQRVFHKYLPDEILRIIEKNSLKEGPARNTVNELIAGFKLRRQSQKRIRWLTSAALLFALTAALAIVLGLLSYFTNLDLLDEQRVNEARYLSSSAEQQITGEEVNRNLSSLLALRSYELDSNAITLNRIRKNLDITPDFKKRVYFPASNSQRTTVSFSQKLDLYLPNLFAQREVKIFDPDSGDLVFTVRPKKRLTHPRVRIREAILSPDVKLVVLAVSFESENKTLKDRKLLQIYDLSEAANEPELIFQEPYNFSMSGQEQRFDFANDHLLVLASRIPNQSRNTKIDVLDTRNLSVRNSFVVEGTFEKFGVTSEYLILGGQRAVDGVYTTSFHDLSNGTKFGDLRYKNKVRDIAVNKSDGIVALLTSRNIYIRQIGEHKILKVRTIGINDYANRLCLSDDGWIVGAMMFPNKINLYDRRTGRLINIAETHGSTRFCAIKKLPNQHDEYALASTGSLSEVDHWELSASEQNFPHLFGTIENMSDFSGNSGFRISKSGKLIFTNSYSEDRGRRVIVVYESKNGTVETVFEKEFPGFSAIMSPDGRFIATEIKDNGFQIFETTGTDIIFKGHYSSFEFDSVDFFNFSDDASVFVTAAQSQTIANRVTSELGPIRVWDTNDGKLISSFKGDDNYVLSKIAISPDGTRLAAAGASDGLYLWDVKNQTRIYKIPATISGLLIGEGSWSLEFSRDNSMLAQYTTRGINGAGGIIIRSADRDEIIASFPVSAEVEKLSFGQRDNFLFITTSDGNVQVRTIRDFSVVANLKHKTTVVDIKVGVNSGKIATLSEGSAGQIKIWDPISFQLLDEIDVPLAVEMDWSENEQYVTILSYSGLKVIRVDSKFLVSELKRKLPENPTLGQWSNFFPKKPYRKILKDKPLPRFDENISSESFQVLLMNSDLMSDPEFVESFVFWIVNNNRADLVPEFIKQGGDLNIRSVKETETNLDPLSFAAWLGHARVFEALYEHRTQIQYSEAENPPLYTALNRLSLGQDLEVEKIIKFLITKNEHEKYLSGSDNLPQELRALLEKFISTTNADH